MSQCSPQQRSNQPGLLSVRNLAVSLSTYDGTVRAVNDVSFDMHHGDALGLVGESGCGKSMTALALMGLLPATATVRGSIKFRGTELVGLPEGTRRRFRGAKMAMVFQDPMTYLDPVKTVGAQIEEPLRLHMGLDSKAARSRALELMDLVGIGAGRERANSYPHQLSGGMRQRVLIAMALTCEPQILIADEPTTALDVTIQAQLLELLQRLRQELGMALLLITHDLGVISGLVDRVHVMYAGHIVETGPVLDVFETPFHPYTSGLMGSIPRTDRPRHRRLQAIPGAPPSALDVLSGCPFAPRCPVATPESYKERPRLVERRPGRWVACWRDSDGHDDV